MKTLLEIGYHEDNDTGIYRIGEVDFGVFSGILDEYLKIYGAEGKKEITLMLAYLIFEVENRFKAQNIIPTGQQIEK